LCGLCSKNPGGACIVGSVAAGGTLVVSGEFLAATLSLLKFGWFFHDWNQKNRLEELLTEDKVEIKSLAAQLTKEELNELTKQEPHKELRRLLSYAARYKK